MADLKDLIDVNINRDVIVIQGVSIPVLFNMKSFAFVTEAYGKPYHVFEADINRMLAKEISLGKNELRLMHALIYAMVRSGGTKCTVQEIEGGIPVADLPDIFQKVLNIYDNQNFQKADQDRLKGTSKKK